MRVLLIGAGGREHALASSISRSGRVREVMSLPGNPGMAGLGPTIEGVSPTDAGAIAALARLHSVDLVVVGPEEPLAAGVSDAIAAVGIPVFGPSRAATRLESSKAFAKSVMERAGVPTPGWRRFGEREPAEDHVRNLDGPFVIKADGLAAGKGVLVSDDRRAALDWVKHCFEGRFGAAGSTIVIEDHVSGPELSVFAVSDGHTAICLTPARDYKRLRDGDAGPNTGGMGSYSPVELAPGLIDDVMRIVIQPTISQMAQDGTPYVGFLYAGLVLTEQGPTVIEFNARLGDPEAQVVLPRLQTDLLDIIESAIANEIDQVELSWSDQHAVNVVLAAPGYPESPEVGARIRGNLGSGPDSVIFHAGTALDDAGRLVTSGGRVLSVVGLGVDLSAARRAAYSRAGTISWPGVVSRGDIGHD